VALLRRVRSDGEGATEQPQPTTLIPPQRCATVELER
jgi:hypothetical protein